MITALLPGIIILVVTWKHLRTVAKSEALKNDIANSINALRGTTNVLFEVTALIAISEMVFILALLRIISGEITAVFYTGLTAYFIASIRARARDFAQPRDEN